MNNQSKNERKNVKTSGLIGLTQNTGYVVIGLVMVLAIAPLGIAIAFGQEASEIDRLSGLYTELKTVYGYNEVRDYNNAGTLVEFRSNGTIFISETATNELVAQYGFYLAEYAPAPALTEDSIIVIGTTQEAVTEYHIR